ncbi:MAG: IS110 family transposase, partial [Solirubrobacteraceae bacterium]
MIVIGTDTHKKTHTCGAVDALTAASRGELTAPARRGAFGKLLHWARALDPERVWAIEDCRHVSGAFERFLIARGERVVRVAPKHMAGARRSSRERGKSDSIDAFSVARAALKEGIDELPGDPHPCALLGAGEPARCFPEPLGGVERPVRDLELWPEVVQMPAQPLRVLAAGGDQIFTVVDQQANVERGTVQV